MMNKSHKLILLILVVLLFMLTISGCQGESSSLPSLATTPTDRIPQTLMSAATAVPTLTPTWTPTQATITPPGAVSPTPDEDIVIFSARGEEPSNSEIYLVHVNSRTLVNLTQNPAYDWGPAWSPDGTQIAFWSNRNNRNIQLYLMNADGSGVQQITNSDLAPLHQPSWSPDGSQIVFDAVDPDDIEGIYIVDIKSGEITTLIDAPSHDLYPAWSPDGNLIAFASDRDSPNEYDLHIYTLNLSTDEVQQLTSDPESDYEPDWSPDGRRIAFSRSINSWPIICIMNTDGSNLQELLVDVEVGGGGEPSWSGDGMMLAFTDSRPIDGEPVLDWINSVWVYSVYVMDITDVDGSGAVRLTSGMLIVSDPDWRP